MTKKILTCATLCLITQMASLSPCTLSKSNDQIVQLTVPNQCAMPQGGTSCGYQAIFNGFGIARALSLKGADFQTALNNLTSDVDCRIAKCCASTSSWKELVTMMRTTESAKQELEKLLVLQYKGAQLVTRPRNLSAYEPWDLSEGQYYLSNNNERVMFGKLEEQAAEKVRKFLAEWREISRQIAEELGIVKDGFKHYQLSAEDLRRRLQEKLEKRLQATLVKCQDQSLTPEELEGALKSRDTYHALLAAGMLDQLIHFQDIDHRIRVSTDTTWLKSNEIGAVVELAKKELGDVAPIFITGDNSIDFEAPLKDDEALNTSQAYQNFVSTFQKNDADAVTGIFLIYLNGLTSKAPVRMTKDDSQSRFTSQAQQACTNGHWISVVAHRAGTERQLIIADSLDNANRTEHYRIKELNALLNGIDYDGDFEAWKDSCRPIDNSITRLLSPQTLQQVSPEISEQTYIKFLAACTVLLGYVAYSYLQELRSREPRRPLIYRSPIEAMTVSGVASPLLAF